METSAARENLIIVRRLTTCSSSKEIVTSSPSVHERVSPYCIAVSADGRFIGFDDFSSTMPSLFLNRQANMIGIVGFRR
jgi:hypothetical protein